MVGTRRRVPRGAVVGLGVALALLLVAVVGGRPGRDGPPLDPRSDGPLGTSALVSLLRGFGAQVELSVGLPGPTDDVAVVLQDRLAQRQAEQLGAWVREGGTLVVTDPSSPLVPPMVDQGLLSKSGPIGRGTCSISALDSIGAIDGGAAVRFRVKAGDQSCFGEVSSAFVVTQPMGLGQVVAVGGAAFVTNDRLGHRDNAVLALTLLAPTPGRTVRFVDAPVPAGGGDKTLGDLVPAGVKRGLLQLAIAFALYALWRAVRLGQPVPEDQAVQVAGSELVAAIGRLLSRTKAPGAAAEMLRSGLRRGLRARLGVPLEASVSTLAAITSARTGVSLDRVMVALDERSVTTDVELVAVARAVASIHQEVPQ